MKTFTIDRDLFNSIYGYMTLLETLLQNEKFMNGKDVDGNDIGLWFRECVHAGILSRQIDQLYDIYEDSKA